MRKVILLLLVLSAGMFAAIPSLTLPNEDINGVDTPQVVWVDQNFDSVKATVNRAVDTVNALQAGTAAFTGLTALTPLYLNSSKRPASGTFTGTGTQFVLSASPTLTGTLTAAAASFTGAVGLTSTLSLTGADFDVTRSSSGAIVGGEASNTSNTASSNARFRATVAGASAGDPYFRYSISGVTDWVTGVDNSDGDAFVITPTSIPGGTTNGLRIGTDGAVSVPGTLAVTGAATVDTLISPKFYTEGTFTMTGTGFTSSPTGTARYTRVGKAVILYIPSIQGESNSTGLTYTGMPAAIRPARTQTVPVEAIVDNTTTLLAGFVDIGTDGVLTVAPRKSLTAMPGAFVTSGSKGISGLTITYSLQ